MQPPTRKLTGALLVVCVWAAVMVSPSYAQIAYSPCPETNNFACAHLTVPLDPSGQTPGTLTLAIRRHRAPVGEGKVAVVALAGGPGQAAIPFASDFAQLLGPIISTRDLIVFDQRGTGSSNPLSCHAFEQWGGEESPASAVAVCANQLGADRRFFTTADSVADIEAIRVAGGYEKLVLYGTSYGTKVAERYAQEYPNDVQALILDSVVPPNGPDQLDQSTFAAVPRVLRQICAFHGCAGITRNPIADLTSLVKRMRHHPLHGRVIDGEGHAHTVSVSSDDLLELLIDGDLEPTLRSEFPAAVHAALHGDSSLLARLYARTLSEPEDTSEGIDLPLYYATTCEEETFPFNRHASPKTRLREAHSRIDALPASTLTPFDKVNAFDLSDIPQCAFWPFASPTPEVNPAPLPSVPTLILSGSEDLRTPTANAREVAREIPGSHVLVVPNVGHSVLGSDYTSCSDHALQALFTGKAIAQCKDKPALPFMRPTPLAPMKLADVRAAKGYSGRSGRTLRAVMLTLHDLSRQLTLLGSEELNLTGDFALKTGGLRSGWVRYSNSAVRFHHYSYIPGVVISGTIAFGSTVLQVTGSAAAQGTLRLGAHERLMGTLGGIPVHLANFETQISNAAIARSAQTKTLRAG